MNIAEKELNVPKIIDASDFAAQKPDEYSVLLYLSYFIPFGEKIFLNWVKTEIPNFNSNDFSEDWTDGKLLGALVNALSGGNFPDYAEMNGLNSRANVEKGMLTGEKIFGIHRIVKIEEFASTTLNALARLGYLSQFYRVKKEGNMPVLIPPAAEKVDVGPLQIPRNVGAGQSVWLELDSKDAGYGSVHAEVQGKEVGDLEVTVEGIIEKVGESTRYHVLFIPPKIDIYTLSIFYAKEHVTGSPFLVNLFPPDPNKVKHLETSPPKEGKSDLSMTFDTADAGDGKLKAHASGDIWGSVPIKVKLESNGEYILSFDPPQQDIYTIDVLWGKFSAYAIGEKTGLIPLDVQDDDKKSCQISFKPPGVDLYTVDVNWDGKPIPGSPFVIDLLPPADPKAVKCSLPIYTIPGEEAELLVDASKAGSGKLDAKCIGDKVGEVPVEINDLGGRAYQVTFTPEENDLYMLEVTYDDRKVRGSPFKIDMQPGVEQETGEIDDYSFPDAAKCLIIDSPRVNDVTLVNRPFTFGVNTKNAGIGELTVDIDGPSIRDNRPTSSTVERPDEKGVYDVTVIPKTPGQYKIHPLWSQDPIPDTPLQVRAIDISDVNEYPNGKPIVGYEIVSESRTSDLKAHAIHNDSGVQYKVKISKGQHKGKPKLSFTPRDPGLYYVHVYVHDHVKDTPVPGSPFLIYYGMPPKPESCRVIGFSPKCYVDQPMKFLVDASEAGTGELAIKPTGPKQKKDKFELSIIDNKNFTRSVTYTPHAVGSHNLAITWANKTVPGGPYITTAGELDLKTDVYTVDNLGETTEQEEAVVKLADGINIPVQKAVLMRIDLEGDLRDGEVSATIVGDVSTVPLEPEIVKKPGDKYDVICNPSVPNKYIMSVKVNGIEVPKSPITVYVSEALVGEPVNMDIFEKPKVEEDTSMFNDFINQIEEPVKTTNEPEISKEPISKPTEIRVQIGKTLKLKVQPKDNKQRNGKLEAKVRDKTIEPEELTIFQDETEGLFEIKFNPTKPDHYIIDVKLNEKEVPSSPFYVHYYPAPDRPSAPPPEPISESAIAEFIAEDLFEIPTGLPYDEEEETDEPRDEVEKTEPVKPNLRPIEESIGEPIVLEPVESFMPEFFEPEEETEEVTPQDAPLNEFTQHIGKSLNVKVRPESDKQRTGELVATAVGEKTGDTDVDITKLPDGTFNARLKPTEPDRYTMSVKLNDADVPNTPFIVNFIYPKSDPYKCKIIGIEDIPDIVEVGEEINLLVDATNAGPGELTVTADNITKEETPSVIRIRPRSGEKGMYEVNYTPNTHGHHHLNFKWFDEVIPDSPVNLLAVDKANTVSFPYGKTAGIDINTDTKLSDLVMKIFQKDAGTQVKGKISKVQKGKYKINFSPKDPGLYFIHVHTKEDKEIPLCPYIVKIGRPIKPEECKVIDLDETCFVREDISFLVDGKEAGDGDLQVKVLGPKGKEVTPLNISDNKDGTYSVSLTPQDVGENKANVLWSGKPIPGSPFPFTVRDLSKEELITKLYLMNRIGALESIKFPREGEVVSTTINKTLLLTIKTRIDEQKNSKLEAQATNTATLENFPVETRMENDIFEVLFTAPSPGHYSVSAMLGGKEVPNSPIPIEYSPSLPIASECKVIGLEDPPPLYQTEKNISFQVDTRLAGDGELNISAKSPRGRPKLEAKPSAVDKRIIDITYIPNVPGTHKVKLSWSGDEIPRSPLTFEAEPIPVYPNGKPVVFDLSLDANESDINHLVFHEDTGNRLKSKINKQGKGKFGITFKPKVPGLYSVLVYIKSREITASPYYIRYAHPPKPEAVVVREVPNEVYVSEPSSFIVDTTNAGISQLKVKVTPPRKGKDGRLNITDHRDGTYTVEHVPEVSGKHSFAINWEKKPIPDSPVKIEVQRRKADDLDSSIISSKASESPEPAMIQEDIISESAIAEFIAEDLFEIPTGLPYDEEEETDEPRDEVEKTEPVKPNLRPIEESIGEPIVLEPVESFMPEFFEPEEETEEVTPQDAPLNEFTQHIGKSLNVKVRPESDKQRTGELVATAVGEKTGDTDVDITKLPDGTFNARLKPTEPDRYTMSVKLNDADVPNTPFIVNFIYPKSDPYKCKIIGIEDIPDIVEVGEEINLLVDATNAGPGELTVTADNITKEETPSVIRIRPRSGEKGMYEVNYTPNTHGHHHLNFKWFDEVIPDSPVNLLAVDKANTVSFPYGKTAGIDINTDTKLSDLVMKIFQKDAGTQVKGKISKVQKGKYKINFSPKDPGLYFIHVHTKEDKEIPLCPYIVKIGRPIKPEECKVIDLDETCFVREDISFLVDGKEAGDGDLQVKVLGPKGKEVTPLNISDNKDGTYSVSLTPQDVGENKANVLWSGKPIPGSPFPFTVRDLSKEELITKLYLMNRIGALESIKFPREGEVVSTTINKTLLLTIKTRIDEQKNSKLEAQATNTATLENFPVETRMENDIFEVLFTAPSPGHYSVSAMLGGKEVPNSPIPIEYSPSLPIASECKVIGLEDPPPLYQTEKNISFQVDTRLAGDGELNISAKSPRGRPKLEAKPSAVDKRIIDITYIPNVPGTHKVKLSWSGDEIPRSPLTFEAEPIPVYPNGKPVVFDLSLDANESDINHLVFHEDTGNRLKSKINKQGKGKFGITFKPKVPGLYSVLVYIKSREITASPYYIRYAHPPKPEAVVVREVPNEVYVSEPSSFIVDTTNAGISQLKVKVTPPRKGKDGRLNITDHRDGTYTVEHVPEVSGKHSFAINWEKKPIPDSPVKIEVQRRKADDLDNSIISSKASESPEPAMIHEDIISVKSVGIEESGAPVSVFGAAILDAPTEPIALGDSADVGIDPHGGRGSIKVNQSGDGKCDVKLNSRGDGTYACTVTPFAVGSCQLNILMNNENIRGSPLILNFCAISGVNLEGETLQVGTVHKFTVDSDKVHPGSLEIYCDENDKSIADTKIISSERDYLCTIVPKQAGHHTISVKYHGHHVIGSPFNVEFIPASASNMSFSLTTPSGTETSDMSASLETKSNNQQIPIQLAELLGGQYSLDFVPTEESEYLLTIKCLVKIKRHEVELSGGRFVFTYGPYPISATKCIVEGEGIVRGEVGSWSSFVVQAEDAGSGELSVIFDDEDFVSSEPIITPIIPSVKYEVKYLVRKSGNFKISLNWNGKPIPGSPFEVTCSIPAGQDSPPIKEYAIIDGSLEYPETVQLGRPLQFTFKPKGDQSIGDLEVAAYSKSIGLTMGSHQVTDEGNYNCTIQLAHLGRYTVDVTWDNKRIEGAPFDVNVIVPSKPENVNVYGPGLQEGRVGEKGNFTIETQGAGSGSVMVNVLGPEGQFEVELEQHPEREGVVTASYLPKVAGNYQIEVYWDGVQVPKSPFTVGVN